MLGQANQFRIANWLAWSHRKYDALTWQWQFRYFSCESKKAQPCHRCILYWIKFIMNEHSVIKRLKHLSEMYTIQVKEVMAICCWRKQFNLMTGCFSFFKFFWIVEWWWWTISKDCLIEDYHSFQRGSGDVHIFEALSLYYNWHEHGDSWPAGLAGTSHG